MGTIFRILLIVIAISCTCTLSAIETNLSTISESANIDKAGERFSKVLSRRKRYLTFPDGSSFQLVFCTQTHGYLQIGDIVWFGTTAALAWELPTDPELFNIFKDQKKDFTSNRRSDTKNHIYYLDEAGKVISKVPYKRRLIVNPAFAKRSVDNVQTKEDANATRVFIKKMHELQKASDFIKLWSNNDIDFHRVARKSLYIKLETFFKALGWNGRECVLRMLCETGQSKGEQQGTFLEEIMKATFTLPKGREFELGVDKEYDSAHAYQEDCAKLYPYCENLYGLQLYDAFDKQ